jgi:uncharacterized protein YndB with AHSA1/START domain
MTKAVAHRREINVGTTELIAEPGVPQVIIHRDFDAPPELVLRAYTEPELLVQWLGPRDAVMTIDRWEPADGGTWRYVHHFGGSDYGFHGVFHGAPSLDGMVQTFEFEGAPGRVSLGTLTFEELGHRTRVRINSIYQSVENRDADLAGGMERGLSEGMDRLDELLARLSVEG